MARLPLAWLDLHAYTGGYSIDRASAFGRVLRRLRLKSGFSQEQLALRCGLTPNFIGLLERGRRGPTLDTIWLLSSELRMRPSEIVALVEEELARPEMRAEQPL